MDQRKKKRRAAAQNIAIVLLSVSAAALLVQTQRYNLGGGGERYFPALFVSRETQTPPAQPALGSLSAPVRVAVSGPYGRWADLCAHTGSEAFSVPGALLMEAIGSAGTARDCREADLRAALAAGPEGGVSLYFDFGSALPVSYLAGLVGAEWSGEAASARRVLLQAEDDAVRLFLWDGGEVCRVYATALPARSLETLADDCPLGSAWFAFDQPETYEHVDPYSLFSDQFTPPPALSVSGAVSDTAALMSALSFNPHTNFRYAESSGAEVVVEGERTLRIRADGEVTYQGGDDALRLADAAGDDAVTGAFELLSALLSSQGGDADLYLQDLRTDGSVQTLRFGYQYAGLPIRLSSGRPAAEVTLDGGCVTRLTVRLRQYAETEGGEPLLPLAQALSIARRYPGRELALRYLDDGSSASVQWLAE